MLIFLNLVRQRKGPKMQPCCAHQPEYTLLPEAHEMQIPPCYLYTAVVPMVSALERFHCVFIGCNSTTPMSSHFQLLLWKPLVMFWCCCVFLKPNNGGRPRSEHSYQLYCHFVSTSNISVAKRELHSLANWLGSVEWDYCQKWTRSQSVCRQVD